MTSLKELHPPPSLTSALEETLNALLQAADEVGESASGSCLGYQASVYYENFQHPPAGAYFSPEWGFEALFNRGTVGAWVEYPDSKVFHKIFSGLPVKNLKDLEVPAEVQNYIRTVQSLILQRLAVAERKFGSDRHMAELRERAETIRLFSLQHFRDLCLQDSTVATRDTRALGGGFRVPAHLQVKGAALRLRLAYNTCQEGYVLFAELSEYLTALSGQTSSYQHPQKKESSLLQQTFHIAGNVNNLSAGSPGSQQTAGDQSVGVSREMLLEKLRQAGVSDADIVELEEAVAEDQGHPTPSGKFSPKVAKWLGKLTGLAAAGAGEITLGTVTGLVTPLVAQYLGLSLEGK